MVISPVPENIVKIVIIGKLEKSPYCHLANGGQATMVTEDILRLTK